MLRAFFGRHKSASTWARSILHEAAAALRLEVLTVHVPRQWADHGTIGDLVREKKPDILVMTNATQTDVETLPPMRALNIIRDPRDIVVSAYFSHRNSHPKQISGVAWTDLLEHREHLLRVDKDAGLAAEIEFSRLFLQPMAEWNYHNPGVLELRMEDILADPVTLWTRAFRHLELLTSDRAVGERLRLAAVRWNLAARRGAPRTVARLRRVLPPVPLRRLPGSYVENALDRFSFSRLSGSGRQPGEEDQHSHYRKGVPGDWRNHLTEDHLAYLRRVHGDIVERLGYEGR